jgi:hypothetical protein
MAAHAVESVLHIGAIAATSFGVLLTLVWYEMAACRPSCALLLPSTMLLHVLASHLVAAAVLLLATASCHAAAADPADHATTVPCRSGDGSSCLVAAVSCPAVPHDWHGTRAFPALSPYLFAGGAWQLCGLCTMLFADMCQRCAFRVSRGARGSDPTRRVYTGVFVYCAVVGLRDVFVGASMAALVGVPAGGAAVLSGLFWLSPPLVAATCGRHWVLRLVSRRFERGHAEDDGASMAEILAGEPMKVGDTFWVKRGESGGDDDELDAVFHPDPADPRRLWRKGAVVCIEPTRFAVQRETKKMSIVTTGTNIFHSGVIVPESQLVWVDRVVSSSAATLLQKARQAMQYIDGRDLTYELMRQSQYPDGAPRPSTRALGESERIDYFMSHSWHDNAKLKWAKLAEVQAEFIVSHGGKHPTFWLDKACIDQGNINEGLKLLVINVMSCRKVLVLCGKTYVTRLWCMLELFVLFAFCGRDDQDALDKLELAPVEDPDEGVTLETILESLANFKLSSARCFDPNEEARLRRVLSAFGERRFEARIRALAPKLRESEARREAAGEKGSGTGLFKMGSSLGSIVSWWGRTPPPRSRTVSPQPPRLKALKDAQTACVQTTPAAAQTARRTIPEVGPSRLKDAQTTRLQSGGAAACNHKRNLN